MLPLGADMANLLQNLDAARTSLWNTVVAINNLDKEASDIRFSEFRQMLVGVTKEAERLSREAKLYDREYRDEDGD